MKIIFLILTVFSSSTKYIKFNNEYLSLKKTYIESNTIVELSKNRIKFTFKKKLILINKEPLCIENDNFNECGINEPNKWSIRLIGDKFKISTRLPGAKKGKCWEVIKDEYDKILQVKMRECKKGNPYQEFDIVDIDSNNEVEVEENFDENKNIELVSSSFNKFNSDSEEFNYDFINIKDNLNKKSSFTKIKKMKRAAKYIRERYFHFDEVFELYNNIEKKLRCK